MDPERKWSEYVVTDNDRCGKLYEHLCNSSHELRIMAASSIHLVLLNSEGKLMNTKHQKDIFEKAYQTALEALTVQVSFCQCCVVYCDFKVYLFIYFYHGVVKK